MQSTTDAKPMILVVSRTRRILSRISLSIGAMLFFLLVFMASGFIGGIQQISNAKVIFSIAISVVSLLTLAAFGLGFWIRHWILWIRTLGTILKWIGFFYGLTGGVIWLLSFIGPTQDQVEMRGFIAMFFVGVPLLLAGILLKRTASHHPTPARPIAEYPDQPPDLPYVNYLDYQRILARRVGAALIDYNVCFAICFFQLFLLGNRETVSTYSGDGLQFFIALILWFLYFPVAEAVWGATFGKRLLKLRVFKEDPDDPSLKVAFARHACDFIDFFFFGAVAIVLAITTKNHKRLGDFVGRSRIGLISGRGVAA